MRLTANAQADIFVGVFRCLCGISGEFDALSTGAKLLYGMMIDRMELSQKNEWIDKQGQAYIYFTVDEVKKIDFKNSAFRNIVKIA